jgi:hypothetical protein
MNDFNRMLPEAGLKRLEGRAQEKGDNWWKDLLRLWRPAGYEAGKEGLRLAVRNGYMNFYLRGQSVARVGFGHGHVPFAETHIKFAVSSADEKRQAYVRLTDIELRCSGEKLDAQYKPNITLNHWIAQADKWAIGKYGSREKVFVDEAVAENGSVIDLEMGLPAWTGGKTARRMDLVLLERVEGRLWIVFWEAKTISDPRLVSRGKPEVLTQLEYYQAYLADKARKEAVKCAYRRNCGILIKLHDLAKEIRPEIEPLNCLIVDAAQAKESELDVCPEPRLVIFDDKTHKPTSWPCHKSQLENALGKRLKIFEQSGSKYVLC